MSEWIDVKNRLPESYKAKAYQRYSPELIGCSRHIETWLSDGVEVWIGRINYDSITIDGLEDENGKIVTHFMEYNPPKPPNCDKPTNTV